MLASIDISERLFLQLALILAVCRGMGLLARHLGQPQVVGEMIAGILLGPSFLGLFWPRFQVWIFPAESLGTLYALSQVGLALYMFLVGLDFRRDLFKPRARSATAVSVSGMLLPFVLGAGLGVWLLVKPGFFGPMIHRIDAALFLGAAMAITAFPVLSRIIDELELSRTSLGTLALAAGAIDDAAAWCVLALVLAILDHNWMIGMTAIGGAFIYAFVILVILRRVLQRFASIQDKRVTQPLLTFILTFLMLGSWFTDVIGVHQVFGAFILGVAVPRGRLATDLQRLLAPLTTAFLLPLFFTHSGLKTRIDLVNSWPMLGIGILILGAACLGKGVAAYASARWCGEDRNTSLAVATLMNSRGLMELIMLNIGLQRGIILPPLFTVMVLMAIVTTFMATPLCRRFARQAIGTSRSLEPSTI